MGRREHRLVQLGRSPSFGARSANPARVHPFGRRLEEARRHRAVALSGKNEPGDQARHPAVRRDLKKTLEDALDVRFFRAWPSLEELRLKPCDAVQDHRFDQALAATEVMQDRGMRDAGVGGDFLKPDRLRPAVEESALSGLQDCAASVLGAPTASRRSRGPGIRSRRVAPGAIADRL